MKLSFVAVVTAAVIIVECLVTAVVLIVFVLLMRSNVFRRHYPSNTNGHVVMNLSLAALTVTVTVTVVMMMFHRSGSS